MGWLLLILLLAITLLGLLWIGKLPRSAWQLTGAALLVGGAGYAWQGLPGYAGVPRVTAQKQMQSGQAPIAIPDNITKNFGEAQQWLVLANALNSEGRYADAANYLRNGVKQHPDDADLWVALGNTLILHAEGVIPPAALFAFERAANIAPDHPGPPFFFGLMQAQKGRLDDARATWGGLLARTPADAPWRADLESRLATLDKLQAMPPEKQGN
ncbi:MAG: tetratricopeptide repeat protein [Parasphingorhabdus sp.]|nr:tetratricopeptide repeat protein [Parasphingorhabdus sp.]